MAQQIIEGIHTFLGSKPFWEGFDALHGSCLTLLEGVEQRFVGDIKKNTHFYTQSLIYKSIGKQKGNKS